ncbi:MAG: 4-methylaminobutanoate oxidase (formaldehyde-forming) [Alphaproteobacteria bacterium MarineAlpha5_Bin5]|nr:MAG: 4-methylaminobutanoate oxidase (formaldehyde-forming) [Alphaproteobacteria bacterium MarineAlpha5_Bin5]|tara:strand:+ start:1397 stop:3817 length:2421 start_codon:yes stop_codon:yes gene_type:complete
MKTHAKVAIIGGGIMGVSLLYHLTKEGWQDVVLIEKGELTSGSTWHAAGQCPHFVGSYNSAKIHNYSNKLYQELESETGQSTGWHGCGSIRLALKDEDVNWFHYVKGILDNVGSPAEIISPDLIKSLHPFLKVEDVLCGLHTPEDGYTDPTSTTNAMAIAARKAGAEIYRHNRVIEIKQCTNFEWELTTEKGKVICEHVVNAAGSFGVEVGNMVGLSNIPSINMIHHYLVTENHPEIEKRDKELPVIRDPFSNCYLRQEADGLIVGVYEKNAKAWALEGMDWRFDMELLEPELDRIEDNLVKGMGRIPLFEEVGIKKTICGPITHVPDGNFLAGPAPGLKNYWMFCGTSFGIAQGGGAGKYMAQWMVHGDADINMLEFDCRRYLGWADKDYAWKRSVDEYTRQYATPFPGEEINVARKIKTTPIYNKLRAHGAQFIDNYGWEKPKWFSPNKEKEEYSYKRNNSFNFVKKECENVHSNVGLLDLSTFSKYEISGKDSKNFLERLCANKIPEKDESIILTHMLNEKGRIQSELTITRFSNNNFYVLSSTSSELRDLDWFIQNQLENEDINIKNITNDYGVLVLAGPRSRNVLSKLTSEDLSNKNFTWLKGKEIILGDVKVKALRINYLGELGWELHHSFNDMEKLYDNLMESGKEFNIANFGNYAVNSLRLEKAYKGWGSELTGEISLVEADMNRFFNLNKKSNFIGSMALREKIDKGIDIKIIYLEVKTDEADPMGNEPVYSDGKIVGVVTSGGYGFRVNKSLAFAYVNADLAKSKKEFEIEIQGIKRKALVLNQAAYDPMNEKLRS